MMLKYLYITLLNAGDLKLINSGKWRKLLFKAEPIHGLVLSEPQKKIPQVGRKQKQSIAGRRKKTNFSFHPTTKIYLHFIYFYSKLFQCEILPFIYLLFVVLVLALNEQ